MNKQIGKTAKKRLKEELLSPSRTGVSPGPRQKAFIRAIAEFLTNESARKSIELEMGKPSALEWARARNSGPMLGWANVEEAEMLLTEFLYRLQS